MTGRALTDPVRAAAATHGLRAAPQNTWGASARARSRRAQRRARPDRRLERNSAVRWRAVDRRRGYPERSTHGFLTRRHLALQTFEVGDQVAPARYVRLTRVCERHTARRSLEQANPEPRLHPRHCLADGGGRQTQTGTGRGERTAIGNRDEQLKSVRRVRDVAQPPIPGHAPIVTGGTPIRESRSQRHRPRPPLSRAPGPW